MVGITIFVAIMAFTTPVEPIPPSTITLIGEKNWCKLYSVHDNTTNRTVYWTVCQGNNMSSVTTP